MIVKHLIALLEDFDPEMPVYIKSIMGEYDYQTLTVDNVAMEYVCDMDSEDGVEKRAVIIGEIE